MPITNILRGAVLAVATAAVLLGAHPASAGGGVMEAGVWQTWQECDNVRLDFEASNQYTFACTFKDAPAVRGWYFRHFYLW
ncbi:hypothetical protein AB0M43_06735 [Longispora sp. NPDC051575]|uniref:hypothetical protein n=1 Tax=Longispora sp. NPDC051575 TaxID=3154943 RepID=UPI00341F946A